MQHPGHLSSDIKLGSADVYASSEERWMLEVLEPARRGKDGETKGLSADEVETRLDAMNRAGGEERINRFRDNARKISEQLGLYKEFSILNNIVSALLNTHSSSVLSTVEGLGAGQIKIIVPTVYREDYLLALRRLPEHPTQNHLSR